MPDVGGVKRTVCLISSCLKAGVLRNKMIKVPVTMPNLGYSSHRLCRYVMTKIYLWDTPLHSIEIQQKKTDNKNLDKYVCKI